MKSRIRLEGILDSEVKFMTKNQWNGIKNKENNLIITGHIIVKKNKKDIPFIYVISTGINEVKRKKRKKLRMLIRLLLVLQKKKLKINLKGFFGLKIFLKTNLY